MARTDLGDKQACPSCGAKFYDLRKRPATCPKCSTSFDPSEESVRSRRGRARVAAHDPAYDEDDEDVKAKKKADADGDEDEEEEVEETAEVDAEADGEAVLADEDEDDDTKPGGDELPEGFNEEDPDLEDAGEDDDSVPLIEDEEEFPEDEIGDLPSDDDEER